MERKAPVQAEHDRQVRRAFQSKQALTTRSGPSCGCMRNKPRPHAPPPEGRIDKHFATTRFRHRPRHSSLNVDEGEGRDWRLQLARDLKTIDVLAITERQKRTARNVFYARNARPQYGSGRENSKHRHWKTTLGRVLAVAARRARSSVPSERFHRLHTRRAPRRNPACTQGDDHQQHGCAPQRGRIGWSDTVEHRPHEPRDHE
jgi:hypothetical protein